MDDVLIEQIQTTRNELASAKELSPDRKDNLQIRLAHASACASGRTEDIGKGFAYFLMDSVRAEIRARDDVAKQIADHVRQQHTAATPKTLREFGYSLVTQWPALSVIVMIWLGEKMGWDKVANTVTAVFK